MIVNRYTDHLMGKTITDIQGLNQYSECVQIHFTDGSYLSMYHEQDCCESVTLEDFDNDAQSLIGGDIIRIEECISNDEEFNPLDYCDYSYTWTFYTIVTSKGTMKLRWYGTSNGYYSESVTLTLNHPKTIYLN